MILVEFDRLKRKEAAILVYMDRGVHSDHVANLFRVNRVTLANDHFHP